MLIGENHRVTYPGGGRKAGENDVSKQKQVGHKPNVHGWPQLHTCH